jgi:2-oxoglutarate ferredoxin oxidoreductase subunit delta
MLFRGYFSMQGGLDKGYPKMRELLINRQWCKGCGVCVAFCPKSVLELDDKEKAVVARFEKCICCRYCELRCPDLAIEMPLVPQYGPNDLSP